PAPRARRSTPPAPRPGARRSARARGWSSWSSSLSCQQILCHPIHQPPPRRLDHLLRKPRVQQRTELLLPLRRRERRRRPVALPHLLEDGLDERGGDEHLRRLPRLGLALLLDRFTLLGARPLPRRRRHRLPH